MIISLLLALATNAFAGGDAVTGKVTAFSGENGQYEMHFVQTSTRTALVPGCTEMDVRVAYRRTPWIVWLLPFLHSGNPTKAETLKAAEALRAAHNSGREIEFGHMGYGLIREKKACTFTSWGLRIHKEDREMILAYHDEI